MKPFLIAVSLAVLLPLAARADGFERRSYAPGWSDPYQPQARQGLIVSLGMGGGSLGISAEGPQRFGAGDLDFRLGYGVSDRLQLFMDLNADGGTTYYGTTAGTWTATLRAQTLLIGDRRGNGLNVNFGVGFGGLTYDPNGIGASSPTGLAVGGGLSFDGRITKNMAISPELFVTWHQVPGDRWGNAGGDATAYGLRLNLVWYLR